MISKYSKILLIDVNRQIDQYLDAQPIEDIYNTYSNVKPSNVLIQDGNGWTELVSISRQPVHDNAVWYDIGSTDEIDRHIYVTSEQLIPVFEPNLTIQGAKGEDRYSYSFHKAYTLKPYMYMRVIDGTRESFTNISIDTFDENLDTGYEIKTKSGFFTVNGFQLSNTAVHGFR